MPNTSASAHWSKDFVEHLRTVHFTLIALCIGLMVLALFPGKTEIQIAHEQALEIQAAVNNWNADMFAIEEARIIKEFIKHNDAPNIVYSDEKPLPLGFDFVINTHGLDDPIWMAPRIAPYNWEVDATIPDTTNRQDRERAFEIPKNIHEFKTLWDGLLRRGSITVPQFVPTTCKVFRKTYNKDKDKFETHPVESFQCKTRVPSTGVEKVDATFGIFTHEGRFQLASRPWHGSEEWAFSEGDGSLEQLFIVFPVNWQTIEFIPQRALIASNEKWKDKFNQKFDDAFRQLAAVDAPLENIDIKSAESILYGEAQRSGDAFEAAGLKIPAEVAVKFGVLLVLGVQLYMLVHLREFGNRVDRNAGFEVAWIGVYTSRLAKLIFVATLLLLPICVVVFLSYRGLNMSEHIKQTWFGVVASNIATLVLSYFIFNSLPRPGNNVEEKPVAFLED